MKSTENSHTLQALTQAHSPPPHPTPESQLLQSMNVHDTSYHPMSIVYINAHSLLHSSTCFDKSTMSREKNFKGFEIF